MQDKTQYTRCPHCKTAFKVTDKMLAMAHGKVRCGACLAVFQATDYFLRPSTKVTSTISVDQGDRPPSQKKAVQDNKVSTSQPSYTLDQNPAIIEKEVAGQTGIDNIRAYESITQESIAQESSSQESLEEESISKKLISAEDFEPEHTSQHDFDQIDIENNEVALQQNKFDREVEASIDALSEIDESYGAGLPESFNVPLNSLDFDTQKGDELDLATESVEDDIDWEEQDEIITDKKDDSFEIDEYIESVPNILEKNQETAIQEIDLNKDFITDIKNQSILDDPEITFEEQEDLESAPTQFVNQAEQSPGSDTRSFDPTIDEFDINAPGKATSVSGDSAISLEYPEAVDYSENHFQPPGDEHLIESEKITEDHLTPDKGDNLEQITEQLAENLTSQIQDTDTVPDPLDEFEGRVEQKSTALRNSIIAFTVITLMTIGSFQFWNNRQHLAWHETWGDLTHTVCSVLPCELKPRRDVSKIRLRQRLVTPAENKDDVLEIKILLTNEASFDQPYPRITIKFSNSRGDEVAVKHFQPTDYIPEKQGQLMASGTEVHIGFETELPHPDALGFEFIFD